jgi:hypothetical protein
LEVYAFAVLEVNQSQLACNVENVASGEGSLYEEGAASGGGKVQ